MRRRVPRWTRAIRERSCLPAARALLETGAVSTLATYRGPPCQCATAPLQLRAEVGKHRELIGGLSNPLFKHSCEPVASSRAIALSRRHDEGTNAGQCQTESLPGQPMKRGCAIS